ncbi:DUF6879 family protein [Streptomyces sp. NPDC020681]|uniref:DUF6879 family protein n=1 Tax=Streptomyces sp. NPDC020681 TaxID=3365083 RepID=UPI00379C5FB5
MLDLRAPALLAEEGERLVREVYKRDFRQRDAAIRDRDSWKLERLQHFEEQGSTSRDALRRGDWEEALRLLDARRDGLLASYREDESRRSFFHRVRVVEWPLTPYLQWELHSLRQHAQCGARIRVVGAEVVAASEDDELVPEVVILGGRTLYQVLYTDSGAPNGAIRFTGPELIGRWESYVQQLYAAGEDVMRYFDRRVADLPPPKTKTSPAAKTKTTKAE